MATQANRDFESVLAASGEFGRTLLNGAMLQQRREEEERRRTEAAAERTSRERLNREMLKWRMQEHGETRADRNAQHADTIALRERELGMREKDSEWERSPENPRNQNGTEVIVGWNPKLQTGFKTTIKAGSAKQFYDSFQQAWGVPFEPAYEVKDKLPNGMEVHAFYTKNQLEQMRSAMPNMPEPKYHEDPVTGERTVSINGKVFKSGVNPEKARNREPMGKKVMDGSQVRYELPVRAEELQREMESEQAAKRRTKMDSLNDHLRQLQEMKARGVKKVQYSELAGPKEAGWIDGGTSVDEAIAALQANMKARGSDVALEAAEGVLAQSMPSGAPTQQGATPGGGVVVLDKQTGKKFRYRGNASDLPLERFEIVQ